MRDIRVATAQFEHRNNDKAYNLSRISDLTRQAGRTRGRDRQLPRVLRSAATRSSSTSTATSSRRWPSRCPTGPSIRALEAIARDIRRRGHGRAASRPTPPAGSTIAM